MLGLQEPVLFHSLSDLLETSVLKVQPETPFCQSNLHKIPVVDGEVVLSKQEVDLTLIVQCSNVLLASWKNDGVRVEIQQQLNTNINWEVSASY